MFRVIEAFSGIGSQAKALKNIGMEFEIVATVDWDINAIIAYDIIHNGAPQLDRYKLIPKEVLVESLSKYTLSTDGKKPLGQNGLKRMDKLTLEYLMAAIERSRNWVSITDVKGTDIPDDIDLFTYSFPCQDLSIAGAWHGNNSGITRGINNRSGMLWEVERILMERRKIQRQMPKFLLMENVSNILCDTHKKNFQEWKNNLSLMGYHNKVYKLNAINFGIPQKRERVYMLSILCNDQEKKKIEEYLSANDLECEMLANNIAIRKTNLKDILRIDYSNPIYKKEADESQPNDTDSRRKIHEENDILYDGNKIITDRVKTITTKQDRNPNSGVIEYEPQGYGKSNFRYLTPRECFMLMGFDEDDYQALIDNNFKINRNTNFFVSSKLYKMAGNSIVVNVLESIFKQVQYINTYILED
ncbi:DNA (cytosine-5)-methyltransferase 1 [Clostridium neonatale]|uniref:DNA (cytosine-5-)-methyltransferase n=1 Tax=Clostridium neonatale TaxID=137838 RepID=UPI00291B7FE1|nr:DNA (cytosine-5-)-methyltransferase [Clostridium neonatale]CAI3232409.1 DNA (cytosine-5)-methyltransferase 1 [Clostridium neonatale]